jgi:hypothetical protein
MPDNGRRHQRITRATPSSDHFRNKIFMPAGSKQPIYAHYVQHCPPDVGAAFIWLKNRDPERWRDQQQIEHAIGKYTISDRPMTEAERAAERATIIDDVGDRSEDLLPAPKA